MKTRRGAVSWLALALSFLLAACVTPGLVAARLRARDRETWVGVGDRRFPRGGS